MKIYVDLDTGTYGDASQIIEIDISDWSPEVLEEFYDMSDSQRIQMTIEASNRQKSKLKKVAICSDCHSDKVFYDAYVGINDKEDIRLFDDVFCEDCSKRTPIDWVTVKDASNEQ